VFKQRCFILALLAVALWLHNFLTGCGFNYTYISTYDTPQRKVTETIDSPNIIPVEVIQAEKTVVQPLEYEMEVEATAYWTHDPVDASGHGIAFDGTPAVAYKTIAVDPKVIPLQSMVYVPSFGWLRANDTGNAIKGNIIDIAMPSREDAFKWGRRKVLVKVRPPVKEKSK
jgi:3D (Asp-Asp-Asp) domain-containing protein